MDEEMKYVAGNLYWTLTCLFTWVVEHHMDKSRTSCQSLMDMSDRETVRVGEPPGTPCRCADVASNSADSSCVISWLLLGRCYGKNSTLIFLQPPRNIKRRSCTACLIFPRLVKLSPPRLCFNLVILHFDPLLHVFVMNSHKQKILSLHIKSRGSGNFKEAGECTVYHLLHNIWPCLTLLDSVYCLFAWSTWWHTHTHTLIIIAGLKPFNMSNTIYSTETCILKKWEGRLMSSGL